MLESIERNMNKSQVQDAHRPQERRDDGQSQRIPNSSLVSHLSSSFPPYKNQSGREFSK